jgi:hypothetical protein
VYIANLAGLIHPGKLKGANTVRAITAVLHTHPPVRIAIAHIIGATGTVQVAIVVASRVHSSQGYEHKLAHAE